jgi:hypothetical protein
MQHMTAADVKAKSPLIPPFFKGGIFSVATLTPLCKRGAGEIFGPNDSEIFQRISDTPH